MEALLSKLNECVLLVDHGLVHQTVNPETAFQLL